MSHFGYGWDIDYKLVPNFGLVLKNVCHADYRLANDIRVVGIWAASADTNKPTCMWQLGNPDNCPFVGDPGIDPKADVIKEADPPNGFNWWKVLKGLSAKFKPTPPVFGDQLLITQQYLFSPYGKDPPHEPGGVLQAARLFPVVSFSCDAIPNSKDDRIEYIRVDYRMNYALDVFNEIIPRPGNPPGANQAGIFRDKEEHPGLLVPTLSTLSRVLGIGNIFAAAEKPLKYEIVGKGLRRGKSIIDGRPATWDNIHQWPKSDTLPSTPGAFHCCHTHWRWGAVAGDTTQPPRSPVSNPGDQFKGLGWTTDLGGPLLDPRIPEQSITFAITANDKDNPQDPNTIVPQASFRDQFKGVPKLVDQGADLIQWFSIEVFRRPEDSSSPWKGTVFIHGLYFGHNRELDAVEGGVPDYLRRPLLKPENPRQAWERAPA